jgi:hypothetical protein
MKELGDGVTVFDDNDEMFAYLDEQEKAANAALEDWQRDLNSGSYGVTCQGGLWIYYEATKPHPEDPPIKPNYLFVRGYSEASPQGEYGFAHKAAFLKELSADAFRYIKLKGWAPLPELVAEKRLLTSRHVMVFV